MVSLGQDYLDQQRDLCPFMSEISGGYFNLLPLELQSIITDNIKVTQARLINKTILKANEIKFCKSISNINRESIYEYMEQTDNIFAVDYYCLENFMKSRDNVTYLFNNGISNNNFVKIGDYQKYYTQCDQINISDFMKVSREKGWLIDIDLLSKYNILKSRGCDKIIPHYSKNKIQHMLKSEKLGLYSAFCSITKLHSWLLTNAIVMGIHCYNFTNNTEIIFDRRSDEYYNTWVLLKDQCKILFDNISVYIEKL